ncbi:hypothetical protein L195_g047385 [Trifolium pratense]|uniref:Uncharacterized protein n=1 Tax=Trifolium pratense TaxID=57577 RepID=A0A2K3MKH2_TRIPR|nr:hypothetical protein L195_g047385 [Trifolium pratense]
MRRKNEQMMARSIRERKIAIGIAEKRSQKEGYSREMGEDVRRRIDGEFCIDGGG